MSNIPNDALSSAFTPVQRPANEALRARKIQLQKNSHHTEDVDELDETAVDAVRDQQQRGGGGRQPSPHPKKPAPEGERVDIAALGEQPQPAPKSKRPDGLRLDISA